MKDGSILIQKPKCILSRLNKKDLYLHKSESKSANYCLSDSLWSHEL